MNNDNEADVRTAIASWFDAIARRDLDAVVESRLAEIVMFDVPPPVSLNGIAEYRESWPQFFEALGQDGVFTPITLKVEAGTDVAFAFATVRCRDAQDDFVVRLTIGLRKVGQRWMVLHEHHSVPAAS